VDLDPVVDELYAGPPETFVATRTAREKQAKQAGDGDVAAQIHGLTKPTVAAWLANRLSRERREDIQALVGIGAALRQATASLSGDDFRELTRRQQLLIRDLMRQAKQLAAAAGKIIGETTAREVEDTLRAAVVDEGAGQELIQGRLTTGLRRTGFDSAGTTPAANRRPPRSVPRSDEQRREEAIARADRDVIEATDAERTAVAERDRAHQTLAETDRRAADALAEVDRLRAELRAAAELQSDLERDQLRARRALDRADGSARAAGRRLAEASKRREELADPAPNRAD
jgi:hypothetical protein